MVPYEAFLSAKPVVTTTDAGGPLDVVADRRDRARGRAARRRARRGAARAARQPGRRTGVGPRGKAVAERVTWDAAIERLLG